MTNRTTRKTVTFNKPFNLTGMDRAIPAGNYEVTTEEEPLGDFMVPVYRRISTTIYIPRPQGRMGIGEILEIDPVELDAELSARV